MGGGWGWVFGREKSPRQWRGGWPGSHPGPGPAGPTVTGRPPNSLHGAEKARRVVSPSYHGSSRERDPDGNAAGVQAPEEAVARRGAQGLRWNGFLKTLPGLPPPFRPAAAPWPSVSQRLERQFLAGSLSPAAFERVSEQGGQIFSSGLPPPDRPFPPLLSAQKKPIVRKPCSQGGARGRPLLPPAHRLARAHQFPPSCASKGK